MQQPDLTLPPVSDKVNTMRSRPFTWSYSALTSFEQCPKKYWHLRVKRDVKEPPTEHTDWGDTVHKAFELRFKKKTPLPPELAKHEALCQTLEGDNPKILHAESQWALTRNLRPTGYFDDDVWVRAKGDLVRVDGFKNDPGYRALVVDWKTGKVREDETQLKLMAAFVFEYYVGVQEVRSIFVWLKGNTISRHDIARTDRTKIWAELLPRVSRMEEAVKNADMPPSPGPLCRYCPVKSCAHNGG